MFTRVVEVSQNQPSEFDTLLIPQRANFREYTSRVYQLNSCPGFTLSAFARAMMVFRETTRCPRSIRLT
jgi:hypothetical protein